MAEPDPINNPPNDPPNDPGDPGGAGSKEAVLADLAKERRERQATQKKLAETEVRLAKLDEQNKSDQDRALDKARQEATDATRTEILTKANERILASELRVVATGKVSDPALAVRLIDIDSGWIDDDGNIDNKAVTKAVTELIKAHPALAANDRGTTGSADGGARGSAAHGTDMNQLIRQRMRG